MAGAAGVSWPIGRHEVRLWTLFVWHLVLLISLFFVIEIFILAGYPDASDTLSGGG
jgi:hypothetical protein